MLNTSSTTAYVKRYIKTNHGILFKINDQTIQMIFIDGQELILDSVHKRVVSIDKNGLVSFIPLKEALDKTKNP